MAKKKTYAKDNLLLKILLAAFVVTLVIYPSITDPINSPKFWALLIISGWLIPNIFENRNYWWAQKNQGKFYLVLLLFAISLTISAFFSDNKYRAVFGEVQRRNGLLTYLGFIILAAVAAKLDIFLNLFRFYCLMLTGTGILSLYGLAQKFGYDPIPWSNPYSPVIGTLGNPNFMGAILGVLSILFLPAIFSKVLNLKVKFLIFVVFLVNFLVIFYTNASQGRLLIIFGTAIFLLFVCYEKNKKIGFIGFIVLFIVATVALLGIFQKGPLAQLLYKSSVSLRGFYWDAGIKMFLENPIFGVGLDNYGTYFNRVRDLEYPLKYGYFVTSNNAHNLPIQLISTGGILVGLTYMAIVIFVFVTAIKKMKQLNSDSRIILLSLIISYLVFQLQSLVSIDNIGVGVWGWVISGLIIGFKSLDLGETNLSGAKYSRSVELIQRSSISTLWSWVFGMLSLILVAQLYQGEKRTFDLESYLVSGSAPLNSQTLQFVEKSINTPLVDPNYKLRISEKLMTVGFKIEAMKIVSDLVSYEPDNLDYLTVHASFAEYTNDYEVAIRDREKISELNPYNAFNYKLLADLYLKTGQIQKSKEILDKVISFAPKSEYFDQIRENLNNQGAG